MFTVTKSLADVSYTDTAFHSFFYQVTFSIAVEIGTTALFRYFPTADFDLED